MRLQVRPGMGRVRRAGILNRWYRRQLKIEVARVLPKWEAVLGVHASWWTIKQMKTRWGGCNPVTRHIWMNLELAKRPRRCLEYILVHELGHILERHHNDRFYAIMDKYLPDWRSLREELKQTPLVHEEWGY